MPEYVVSVEAKGYGDPVDDGERFLAAVGSLQLNPEPQCAQDHDRNMLMITFPLEAPDAREAHDDAVELWSGVWDVAFPDMAPPTALAVSARLSEDRSLLAARAETASLRIDPATAPDDFDPNADLDEQ